MMGGDIIERFLAAGHKPVLDEDGEPDCFAFSYEFHNGPACRVCLESRCEHCDNGDPFDPCPGQEEVDRRAKARRYEEYLKLKEEFEVVDHDR